MEHKKYLKPIEPGTWGIIEDTDELPPAEMEANLEYPPDMIAVYTAFRDRVYNPTSALYPSCGFDASPARVFSEVTFVDAERGNRGCVQKLQEAGFHALKSDIKAYVPHEAHDLLILQNPTILVEWATRHLQLGGYIIANDYHDSASELFNLADEFSLWGTINVTRDNKATISQNLSDLFQRVQNAEELRQCRPKYYAYLQEEVRALALNRRGFNINRPFDEVLRDYFANMEEEMPYRREADHYIFVKK